MINGLIDIDVNYGMEICFCCVETWTFRKVDHILCTHLKFWNVVLEKDGGDQLDWSRGKCRSLTKSRGINVCSINNEIKTLVYWSNIMYELFSKTHNWRRDRVKGRSEGKTRKKTEASTGWT